MEWLIKWFGLDKLKHAAVCLLIGGCIGTFLSLLGADFATSAVAAVFCAEVAAVTKEWCDKVYGSNWSWSDLAADQVGIALAVAWLVMWHFSKG